MAKAEEPKKISMTELRKLPRSQQRHMLVQGLVEGEPKVEAKK